MTNTSRWVAGVVLVVAIGLSGCAGGRISLGTDAGACFRALPPAQAAIHDKGKLVGVRRVSATTLRARLPRNTTLATLPDQDLCVFGFAGTYGPGVVAGATNAKSGHFAIVAVGRTHTVVVAAVVVDQLPTRFRHLH